MSKLAHSDDESMAKIEERRLGKSELAMQLEQFEALLDRQRVDIEAYKAYVAATHRRQDRMLDLCNKLIAEIMHLQA